MNGYIGSIYFLFIDFSFLIDPTRIPLIEGALPKYHTGKGNSNNFTENSSRLVVVQTRESWHQNVKQKSTVKKAYNYFGGRVSTVKLLKLKDWNVEYKTSNIFI